MTPPPSSSPLVEKVRLAVFGETSDPEQREGDRRAAAPGNGEG